MIPLDRTASYHPDADPMDAAAEEFVARFRNGERPSVDEYAARHPELADDIRKLFPMLVALEECGSTAEGTKASAGVGRQPGERMGGFTLVRRIGEGGMGIVFEAVQDSLGRPVAIKFLKGVGSGRVARERFQREVQAVARLHHPNVVTVYGSGEHDGLPYYAMQLVRGRGLDTYLDERRATGSTPTSGDLRKAVGLATQVADALAYAHRQGVIHRDIKPSNLLVDEADRVWVADFGLAFIDGNNHLTDTGGIVGTRQYMAPEQYNGWADPRTDVYALGVTLYELATGTSAFDAATPQEVLRKVMTVDVTAPRKRNPLIHPDLETVILKAMAAEPAHRYPTAAAFADDLRLLAEGKPVSARRLSNAAKAVRWARRNPMAAGLAATVVLLMTVVTVLSAWAALRFNRLKNEAETARGTIEKQRDTIGRQLEDKEKAETESNAQLSRFLLRTAQAQMAERNGGKREALAALAEAAALSHRLDLPGEHRNTLRREYVAALAMSDLVPAPERSWAIPGFSTDTQVAFSPCGEVFILGDKSGGVSVRSTHDNSERYKLAGLPWERSFEVVGLRFSGTGKLLAGKVGAMIRVWRVSDGKLIGLYGPMGGPPDAFDLMADDAGVAWADGNGGLRIRRFADEIDSRIPSLPLRPLVVRCDPTGRRVAYCSERESAVRVIDLDSGVSTRCPMPKAIDQFAWAPDGVTFAAVGLYSNDVLVASVLRPSAPPLELRGHRGRVVQLTFHPHESLLASCSWDETLRVWDLNRPAMPIITRHSLSFQSLGFSADGQWLTPGVADDRLWAWEWVRPTAGEVVVQYQLGTLHGAALSPDGKTLLGLGEAGLQAWDVTRPQRPVATFPTIPQTPDDVANLTPFGLDTFPSAASLGVQGRLDRRLYKPVTALSGRRLRFSSDGSELTIGAEGGLTTVSVRSDPLGVFRFSAHATRPDLGGYEHSWSRDGRLAAVMPASGDVKVVDRDFQTVVRLPRPGNTGTPVFSPDNQWLASGAWPQKGVKVWHLPTEQAVRALAPFAISVPRDVLKGASVQSFTTATTASAHFSPDGKWLLIGTGRGYQFYHTDGWKPAHRVPRFDGGHIPCLAAFTPDGKTVALWTKPGHISLHNPADGREYAVLPVTARTGSIDSNGEIQFTPDGRRLVVVVSQKQIQVWDIAELRKQLTAVGLDWDTPK